MKEKTKEILDLLDAHAVKFGCKRIRRSFLVWPDSDLVSVGIAFVHREWPDGAVSVYPCIQAFWLEVDRVYAETISVRYRQYAIPTCAIQSEILPPLVFLAEECFDDVFARFERWVINVGFELKRKCSHREAIYKWSFDSLSTGALVVSPIKVFIMDRLINPGMDISRRSELISAKIVNDWEQAEFQRLRSIYVNIFPRG